MKKGFTLLEIMVAMALLFIVLATVYESFQVHVRSIKLAREVQNGVRSSRLTFAMIAKDLQSAFREDDTEGQQQAVGDEKPPSFLVQTGREDKRPRDRIAFLTLGPSWSPVFVPSPRPHEVDYFMAEDEDRGYWKLMRREDLTPDDDILTGGSTWTLVEKVLGFEVLCTDDDGNDVETWNSKEQKKLPKSVVIKLWIGDSEDSEEKDPEPFVLRVAIPSKPEEKTE